MTTTTTYTEAKELDYRETDGVEVTLLWYPSSDVARSV